MRIKKVSRRILIILCTYMCKTLFSVFLCFPGVQASELEPLVGGIGTDMIDGVVPEGDEREEDLPDLKVAFRSDCQPDMLIGFFA